MSGNVKMKIGRSTTGKERRQRRKYSSYSSYIYKVLKQVHPSLGISKKAMSIVDDCMHSLFHHLLTEAGQVVRYNGRRTLTPRALRTAVRLLLPGELGRLAASEGRKALPYHRQADLE